MHWMPFGMQEAIGADVKRALLVSRGVAALYACAILYDSVALIATRRKQPTGLLFATEASPDVLLRRPHLGSRLAFHDEMEYRFCSTRMIALEYLHSIHVEVPPYVGSRLMSRLFIHTCGSRQQAPHN